MDAQSMFRYKKLSERVQVEIEVNVRCAGAHTKRTSSHTMHIKAGSPEVLQAEMDTIIAPASVAASKNVLSACGEIWLQLQPRLFPPQKDTEVSVLEREIPPSLENSTPADNETDELANGELANPLAPVEGA